MGAHQPRASHTCALEGLSSSCQPLCWCFSDSGHSAGPWSVRAWSGSTEHWASASIPTFCVPQQLWVLALREKTGQPESLLVLYYIGCLWNQFFFFLNIKTKPHLMPFVGDFPGNPPGPPANGPSLKGAGCLLPVGLAPSLLVLRATSCPQPLKP